MARTKKQEPLKETATVVTRAEKKDATKNFYKERFGGEDTENINDVKGRVGSVLDIMKKDGDVAYEGGMYALKARMVTEAPVQKEEKAVEETTKKSTKKTAKKVAEEVVKEEKTEEKPVKKSTKKAKATKKEPLPPAPIQPIAPVAPVTPEVAPEPIPEEKKPEPKKRGRKAKAVEIPAEEPAKTEEVAPAEKAEEKTVELPVVQVEEKPETGLVVKENAPIVKKEVIDVSFFLGGKTPAKETAKEPAKATAPAPEKTPAKEEKQPEKVEKKPEIKAEKKPENKPAQKVQPQNVRKLSENGLHHVKKPVQKPQTADERLREAFLKRLRSLGGDYFEYYSVYLLERYSLKNGRRLEGLRISGGDHDGGIDGEIEVTDKMGFKETIYIQSKNWNPEKGDEKLWVVGETLLQQFIGACACRQAREGKQNCRGIFVTTSRFTPEAKRILDTMSDKIIGYDGADVYEAAKECGFGLVEKNGVWALDEKLLSGPKAFFNLY